MIRLLTAAMLCIFWMVSSAAAHEVRPAFLEIIETAPDRYAITWKVPARGENRLAVYVRLPTNCRQENEPAGVFIDAAYISRWQAACDGGLAGQVISIDGLSATYTDALAKIVNLDGTAQTSRISPDFPDLTVAEAPTPLDTARTYFQLGVEHIMMGVDHLLFVFALLLLIRNTRALLLTITSFTVAHSITLGFSALDMASVPQPPVEALIALSIMFVASEILRAGRGRVDLSSRYPWLISFIFGLLHGFGFGGALREIGLPQKDVPLALLSFNLGVEAGQVLFVAIVILAAAGIRLLPAFNMGRVRVCLAYLIGTLSAFWFVQRVAGFG
jgi:hydrogenase/urease accessory protein HupE